jgi:hypothetical protein
MKISMKTLGIVSALTLGLPLAMAAPAAAAPQSTASRTTHEAVVVTSIDRTTRSATMQNAEGETKTVQFPDEVKAYDTLKVGDHIDIDYHESIALSLLPPGTKPSMSQSSSVNRVAQGVGMATRQTTVSATVVSVDARNNKVTFRGPRGNTQTVSVEDPDVQKRLPDLRAGQVVQITYTEAMAASVRPSSPASSKWQP